jgi:hypothetical protein
MQHLKRRTKNMRRSPRLKNKRNLRKQRKNPRGQSASTLVVHRIVNSTYSTIPCVTGQSEQRGPQPGTLGAISPDCPVCTGMSGVHQTVWTMIGSNGRLLQTSMVG